MGIGPGVVHDSVEENAAGRGDADGRKPKLVLGMPHFAGSREPLFAPFLCCERVVVVLLVPIIVGGWAEGVVGS